MKTIFLTTVQFSGTRFLNYSIINAIRPNFTRMQIANVKGFYRIADTVEGKLTHTNTNNISELIHGIQARLSKATAIDVGIVTAHIGDSNKGFIPFRDQERIINTFPTAATLRDPLASILSREGRRHDDHQQYLVDGYVSLADTYKDIFHVPVDLYANKSYEDRFILLKDLFDFMGIMPIDKDYISRTASEWQVMGDTQNDATVSENNKKRAAQLKEWYKTGNIKEIKREIPNCYKYLKDRESILRPMLERAGYTNLIWWE